jgi:hypothetical protein
MKEAITIILIMIKTVESYKSTYRAISVVEFRGPNNEIEIDLSPLFRFTVEGVTARLQASTRTSR